MLFYFFFSLISSFIVPEWNITEYSPREGPTEGGVEVLVNIKQQIYYQTAYCKFGEITVFATDVKSHSLKCKAPQHEPGVVDFRVTFNNNDWDMISPETFTYVGMSQEKMRSFINFLIAFCGILILLMGIYFMFRTPLTVKNEDENVPLLKDNNSP